MNGRGTPPRRVLRPRRTLGWWLWGIAGLFGEALITVGVVLVLFLGWQLVWTDVVGEAEQSRTVDQLQQSFTQDATGGTTDFDEIATGEAFAIVRIPRFGEDYARPILQGTTRDILSQGVGHYEDTAQPGEIGNFALAGHRTTYGKPFNQIDELRVGDAIIIETRDTYYVYRFVESAIVLPSEVDVILPVPREPGVAPVEAVLTMTSCHPEFSSRQRWIAWSRLEASYPRADGLPSDLVLLGEG